MNSYMQGKWSWVEGAHGARNGLINELSDADLAFSMGGQTMTLGALCREFGEIEHSYVESLKTLKHDWSYHNQEAGLENSVSKLQAWYQTLDSQMKETVAAFSDEDLKQMVERNAAGGGFPASIELQLEIYLQALAIFAGKFSIYLRAMDKPLPADFLAFIG